MLSKTRIGKLPLVSLCISYPVFCISFSHPILTIIYSTGPALGDRPTDHRQCIKFTPETNFVGINWGNHFVIGRAARLRIWHTQDCSGSYTDIYSPADDNKQGTNTCLLESANGGPWHSVRFFGLFDDDPSDPYAKSGPPVHAHGPPRTHDGAPKVPNPLGFRL